MRHRVLWSFAISFAALCLSAPTAFAQAKPKTKVTVVMAGDGFQYITQHIATRGGLFAEEGLDVETIDAGSGPRQVAALMGGSAQFGGFGMVQAMKADSEGGELVVFSSLSNIFDQKIVLSNDAVKRTGITADMPIDEKVKRLKGLRIAITSPGSTTDIIVRSLLQVRGMNADESLKILPMGGGSNMLAAMEKGATDAFIWASPQSQMAVSRGVGQIVINPFTGEIPEFAGVHYMVMVTSRETLKKQPEVIRAATRALTRAMKLARERPEEAKKLVRQQFPDTDEAVFNAAWTDYRKAIPQTPVITRDQYLATEKWLNITAKPAISVPYDTVIFDGDAKSAAAEILK